MKHLSTFLILILFNFIFACGVTQVGGKNRCKYANDKDACLKALNDIKAGKNQPKNDKDEICDSKDNDEDGKIDEDFKLGTACEVQKEGCLGSLKGTRVCSADQEKAVCKYEKSLNPEKCDGIDNNCDGDIDEGFGLGELCSKKENGEGGITCNIPGKKVCSDNDPDKAICQLDKSLGELCDGLDNDCDNKVDEGFKDLNSKCEYVNGTCKADGQNICSKDKKSVECGLDPSWLSSNPELCDGKDNNCDGKIDEGFKIGQSCSVNSSIDKTLCKGTFTCSSGQGATTAICEQTKEDSNKETCDQKDNDCDGTIDEGVKTLFYVDKDGDGVGLASLTLEACNKPNGYALISGDCDDTKKEVYPKNKEVCDSLDNDCDKQTDEGVSITYYVDKDKDGYGHKGTTNFSCKAPSGFVSNADDCNDGDKNINPGATEICDSKDNDCDKKIDNIQSSITVYADNDKDGQGDPNNKKTIAVSGCPATIPTGFVNNKNDCFDGDNTVFKGADELCDSKDNDCDTKFDEGFEDKSKSCSKGVGACKGLGTYYCSPDKKSLLCSAPIVNSTDEYCGDKIDNDCDGKTDEGFLDFNKTCTEGKGKCQATGTNMCSPDRKSLKCSAIPSPAQKEMCFYL